MEKKYLDQLVQKTKETLSDMTDFSIENGAPFTPIANFQPLEIKVGIPFLGKTKEGMFIFHFEPKTVQKLVYRVYKITSAPGNEMLVYDGMGEISNILTGNIKEIWIGSGMENFEYFVPSIIARENYQPQAALEEEIDIIPFTLDANDKFYIELRYKPYKK